MDQLDAIMSKMKAINCYIWCNKAQIREYLDYFDARGCYMDLLTWHKTNPTPACKNKYLSDTEYLLYFRDPGVPLYGTYETKRKYYVSPYNKADKDKFGHPTIKPLNIIKNLIFNSSQPGDTVLDPFLGSGTTAVACAELGRDCIGIEINPEYYNIAVNRTSSIKDVNEWGF